MSDALAIAASGLKSEEYFIEKIANDLANLNTANYKATKLTFEDVLYQNIQGINQPSDSQSAIQIGLGTAVYKSSKDFTLGPLKPSTNWNDVAINGVGFYQITNLDGSMAYSRNSSLSIDEDHYLSTQDES